MAVALDMRRLTSHFAFAALILDPHEFFEFAISFAV